MTLKQCPTLKHAIVTLKHSRHTLKHGHSENETASPHLNMVIMKMKHCPTLKHGPGENTRLPAVKHGASDNERLQLESALPPSKHGAYNLRRNHKAY